METSKGQWSFMENPTVLFPVWEQKEGLTVKGMLFINFQSGIGAKYLIFLTKLKEKTSLCDLVS